MSRILSWLSILALVLAAGCSESDSPATDAGTTDTPPAHSTAQADDNPGTTNDVVDEAVEEVNEYIYRCTTGEEFVIVYGDQTAELYVNDIYHQLRQQPSGSGARYTDETVELIIKGDQALVMVGDTTHDCLAIEVYEQSAPGNDVVPQPGILEHH